MKNLSILVFLTLTFSLTSFAQDLKLYSDKKESTIVYGMNHPLHQWTAESKSATSVILTDKNKEQIKNVAVSAKISSFDSKNANRDSHTIEVTEAIKYPDVTFTSTSIKQDGNKLTICGKLKFHNVTKPVTFEAEKSNHNNKLVVKGGFNIKMTDYGISPPTLMAVPTDDEIKLSFHMVY